MTKIISTKLSNYDYKIKLSSHKEMVDKYLYDYKYDMPYIDLLAYENSLTKLVIKAKSTYKYIN